MGFNRHPPSAAAAKLRLMCSYGGRILRRPFGKSLIYAGGETRIVAVDRRTTAASLSALTSHLSGAIFNDYPFHIKYQLPNEDLDSLISVVTDEDLFNMIEEQDRLTAPARIRLFLFPAKPKPESWSGDVLKGAISPKEHSAYYEPLLMDAPIKSGSSGGEDRHEAESMVLGTNFSFGSSSSSISMSSLPPVEIVHCEENRSKLLEKKVRVPSSASMESISSVGIATTPSSNIEFCQEPLIQITPEAPLFVVESGISVSEPFVKTVPTKTEQVTGYHPSCNQPDAKQLLQETPFIGDGFHYTPHHFSSPMPMFYPVYQMPVHHPTPFPQNQMYPLYLLPIPPAQYHAIPMQSNTWDWPSPHPLAAVTSSFVDKEVFGSHVLLESSTKSYHSNAADTAASCLDQLVIAQQEAPVSVSGTSSPTASWVGEFDEDTAYNPVYKTQPPPPSPTSQYQMVMKEAFLSTESSVQQPNSTEDTIFPKR